MSKNATAETNRKCREIIEAIVSRCNESDAPGLKLAFDSDWGGNTLTLHDFKLGHTHVGVPDGSFADLVDILHGTLCRGRGLSYACPPKKK
ncbi:hypothetical protein K2D_16610 [Planctomycetes bacterium K2D]|nr:hypothetical protein K2D_16610 [Planctomycetes bacterium K2D]